MASTAGRRHKKVLGKAKGYYNARRKVFRAAKQAVIKAGQYAYRDRRAKKREFRALWITRINAAARVHGLSYSRLIDGPEQGRASRSTARCSPISRCTTRPPLARSRSRPRRSLGGLSALCLTRVSEFRVPTLDALTERVARGDRRERLAVARSMKCACAGWARRACSPSSCKALGSAAGRRAAARPASAINEAKQRLEQALEARRASSSARRSSASCAAGHSM